LRPKNHFHRKENWKGFERFEKTTPHENYVRCKKGKGWGGRQNRKSHEREKTTQQDFDRMKKGKKVQKKLRRDRQLMFSWDSSSRC